MDSRLRSPELWDLADQIGSFIQYWGFKRVHGQIWAHLFLSTKPLNSVELRKRLDISKALVSLTVKDLIRYGAIRESGRAERGVIFYVANPQMTEAILNVLRSREKKMMAQIQTAVRTVSELSSMEKENLNIDTVRIKQLGDLVDGVKASLEALLSSENLDHIAINRFFGLKD